MFNITGGEIIIVLVLALVVLGPDKLPGFIRSAGRLYSELRRMASGFKAEFDDAMAEPMREMRDTADMAKRWFEAPDDDEAVDDGADEIDFDGELPGAEGEEGEEGDEDGEDDEEAGAAASDLDAAAHDDPGTDGVTDDDDDDDDDDPNFYDEHGNLLDATMIAAMIEQAEQRPEGSGATTP